MSKLPRDFSKSVIYRIICNNIEIKECYVGSTTNFDQRKVSHKNACNSSYNTSHNAYVYKFIRSHGGFNEWRIIQIETYPCNSKEELLIRERYQKEQFKATLNSNIPILTENDKTPEKINLKKEIRKYKDIEHRKLIRENKLELNKEYYAKHKLCRLCQQTNSIQHRNSIHHIKNFILS